MQPTNWEVPEKVTALHAWRRYITRNFEYLFYGFISGFIPAFILIVMNYDSIDVTSNAILLGIISFFLSPFINTISIYFFGNTLGKKILGIKILELNDIKPSPIRILKREFWVLVRGMWLGVPFITYLPIFLSYRDLIDDQVTSWDKQMNFKIIYHTQRPWVTAVTISLIILLYFIFKPLHFSILII